MKTSKTQSKNNSVVHAFLLLIISAFAFTACQQDEMMVSPKTPSETMTTPSQSVSSEANVVTLYPSLSAKTSWELQQARAATARYRNLENAKKDGYGDINVIVENMGYHYMKSTYVDATFDIRKPEILVYSKHEDGTFELVAVEYAIPLDQSVDAPAGFTGVNDVWNHNDGFGLWLLHAWVWSYNPDGVFNSTNPLVHLH